MKKLSFMAGAMLLATSAFAETQDLEMKFNGRFNFQGAGLKQSNLVGTEKNLSANRKNLALNTNAFVGVKVSAENEMMKYGANLSLFTSTSPTAASNYERSHIFLESQYGKLELGSNFDAGGTMRITALTISHAGGDDASGYAYTTINNVFLGFNGPSMYPSTFFLDILDSKNREAPRKITYYSPEFKGVQLGVSYIPDTGNFGYGTINSKDDLYNTATAQYYTGVGAAKTMFTEQKPIKDAFSLGLSFKHALPNDVNIKLALTGEIGKPAYDGIKTVTPYSVHGVTQPKVVTNYKLAKLQTYNIGGVITKGNYSLAASYADWNKSMTSEEVYGKDRKTRIYSVGGAYAQGPVGISLTYIKTDQYNNKMNTYTLSTDYKLAPGLMPYAELAYFKGNATLPGPFSILTFNNGSSSSRNFKGMVFVLGTKVMF